MLEGLNINLIPFTVVLIFILIDVISGFIKAVSNKTIASTGMREGLWHKAGTILLELLALVCSQVHLFIEGLPQELETIYLVVSVYIIVMEIISILENIADINPKLSLSKLLNMYGFGKKNEDSED